MYSEVKQKDGAINPILAVLFAISISLIISAVNLFIFMRSDMYQKVRLIQNPEQVLSSDETLDTTSPLNSKNLYIIKSEIDEQFDLLRDDIDFSIYDVSETTLGI